MHFAVLYCTVLRCTVHAMYFTSRNGRITIRWLGAALVLTQFCSMEDILTGIFTHTNHILINSPTLLRTYTGFYQPLAMTGRL
eukprot:1183191-Prorocentrum_minimum.AAC.1